MEEPLINLRPSSDFEKLMWAESRIKELLKELAESEQKRGILQSEMDEFLETTEVGRLQQVIHKRKMQVKILEESNRKLRLENQRLWKATQNL